ncbi:hypothetical protein MUN81_12060 [Hymenobacter sp. 5317J-9]|uniref:hypothetical protein n=1 Tax=Hymenobacter sp. 5317J-9 TaxID=2932250 RepID=UPI001FD68752|nr:hypothetical protein [Hymenobacter sp. 5317J-9]UOQ95997.1 hypothetical protein MUN81_12060 [Hymenobacter sp. 5317J-9]
MFPEDIDDLFREKLDGHATPPADDLWSRLQAAAPAEPAEPAAPAPDARLDQLFQQRLSAHATPPRRELWERLEDEHLRPRKRRAAAWWPMAIAAALALLLVAGGTKLWLGSPAGSTKTGTIASQQSTGSVASPQVQAATAGLPQGAGVAETGKNAASIAATTPAETSKNILAESAQKNATLRATRSSDIASTASKAGQPASEQLPRHLKGTARRLDAATEQAPLVARAATRPAPQPAPATPADELGNAPATAPVVAAQTTPTATPEIVPVGATELITVDVRTGSAPASRLAQVTTSAVASSEVAGERRRLGGRLLQQAGHLVRGERVSLAEVAGLPDNVTVRATVAGRTVSKSIQL